MLKFTALYKYKDILKKYMKTFSLENCKKIIAIYFFLSIIVSVRKW